MFTYYTIPFELILSWFLLTDYWIVFYGVFAQYLFFHAFSYFVVSWFYPSICFSYLSLYIAYRYLDPPTVSSPQKNVGKTKRRSLLSRFVRCELSWYVYGVVVVVCVCNIIPKTLPGSNEITGECRQLQLHMLDSFVVCNRTYTTFDTFGQPITRTIHPKRRQSIPMRTICHAAVTLSLFHHLCEDFKKNAAILMKSMKWNDKTGYPIVNMYQVMSHLPNLDICLTFPFQGLAAIH